jgi:hypothetical protein
MSTPPPTATRGAPSPARLSAAQRRELESELERELAALERRLVIERQAESADPVVTAGHARAMASDTIVRRDEVAAALARLAADEYGTCSRCGVIFHTFSSKRYRREWRLLLFALNVQLYTVVRTRSQGDWVGGAR